MAVVSNPYHSRIRVTYQTGTNEQGKPVMKQKAFANVKATSLDQDVFDVANSLASLINFPVITIERFDQEELVNV